MPNKLAHIINNLSEEDLLSIREDLVAGNIDRLINQRLYDLTPTKSGMCAVCNARVGKEHYTLMFGPEHFRQKASFDAVDCLSYFLDRLKEKEGLREQKHTQTPLK
jgi:hypothetical protein